MQETETDLRNSNRDKLAKNQIDLLIERFFHQFDNRNGKAPSLAAFDSLFIKTAVIVRGFENDCERYTLHEFLEPRIRLLTEGVITEFSEWETKATTHVAGTVAARISTYAKCGFHEKEPYNGCGSKLFQLGCFRDQWLITALAWSDDSSDALS